MNILPPTTAEATTRVTALPEHKIGIHFALPATEKMERLAAVDRPVMVACFATTLCLLLRRESILNGEVGAHGDLREGLALFFTSDRNRSLAIIKELLDALCLNVPAWVEVAWFDQAEDIWRPYFRTETPLPFDRWLTPELFHLRAILMASVMTTPPDAPQQ